MDTYEISVESRPIVALVLIPGMSSSCIVIFVGSTFATTGCGLSFELWEISAGYGLPQDCTGVSAVGVESAGADSYKMSGVGTKEDEGVSPPYPPNVNWRDTMRRSNVLAFCRTDSRRSKGSHWRNGVEAQVFQCVGRVPTRLNICPVRIKASSNSTGMVGGRRPSMVGLSEVLEDVAVESQVGRKVPEVVLRKRVSSGITY